MATHLLFSYRQLFAIQARSPFHRLLDPLVSFLLHLTHYFWELLYPCSICFTSMYNPLTFHRNHALSNISRIVRSYACNQDPVRTLNSCSNPCIPWTLKEILCTTPLGVSRSSSFLYCYTFHFCSFLEDLTTVNFLSRSKVKHAQ